MIEEAIIFVIGEEKSCFAPNLGVGSQGVKDLRNVPGPVIGWPVGVLSVSLGRDDPAHLRELVVQSILAEEIEEGAACRDAGGGPDILE